MPTRIRLQRFGKKGQPFYRIVVTDNRAPRDGKFIENLGTYNPLTKPATIEINVERSLYWIQVGAQPTDTARAILSYKGIIYKNHLLNGVKKGALTQEQADVKFNAWLEEKENKIQQKIKDKELVKKDLLKKKFQEEVAVNEVRAKAISEKRAKLAEKETSAKVDAETATEQVVAEKTEEALDVPQTVNKETPKTEANEVPQAVVEETPQAEVNEVPQAVVEETPQTEANEVPQAVVEETPAEEKSAENEDKSK